MEELIKASKAYEMTVNGIEKKCDEVIRIINDAILEATKIGDYAAHILFDPLPAHVLDRVYDALIAAGYDICGLSDEDIYISWADAEVDEPPTKPTAADVDMQTKVDSLVGVINESTTVSDDSYDGYDEYKNYYVKVPFGYIRDWIHDSMYYRALVNGGVDNWEWYGEAISEFCSEEHARDMDEAISEYMRSCIKDCIIVE